MKKKKFIIYVIALLCIWFFVIQREYSVKITIQKNSLTTKSFDSKNIIEQQINKEPTEIIIDTSKFKNVIQKKIDKTQKLPTAIIIGASKCGK